MHEEQQIIFDRHYGRFALQHGFGVGETHLSNRAMNHPRFSSPEPGYQYPRKNVLILHTLGESRMPECTAREDLHSFAVELRKLAYTMPAGHEDRLIHLSERMVRRAHQVAAHRSMDSA